MGRPRRNRFERSTDPLPTLEPVLIPPEHLDGDCPRSVRSHLWRCPSCQTPHLSADPCLNLKCSNCRDAVASRRARRLYERMGAPPLALFTITVPRPWVPRLPATFYREFERAVWTILKDWFEVTQRASGIGARAYWHPCGDICEGCGWDPGTSPETDSRVSICQLGACPECGLVQAPGPHINFLVPLLTVDRTSPRSLWWTVSERHLSMLRGAVGMLLRHVARTLELEPTAPVVWYNFRVEEPRKMHAFRYFARGFPAWDGVMKGVLHDGRYYGLFAGRKSDRAQTYRDSVSESVDWDRETAHCARCGTECEYRGSLMGGTELLADFVFTWGALSPEMRYPSEKP